MYTDINACHEMSQLVLSLFRNSKQQSLCCITLNYLMLLITTKQNSTTTLLCLYRARNKITQLSIPTHEQLQCHRLKFIKNHLKTPTCFGLRPSSESYNVLAKTTIIMTTVGCSYAKSKVNVYMFK